MSVLLDLSIFPIGETNGLSRFVAEIVDMIAASGHAYQLTAMGTLVETDRLSEALSLIDKSHAILERQGCRRVYATAKLDIRPNVSGRLTGKVASVNARLDPQSPATRDIST